METLNDGTVAGRRYCGKMGRLLISGALLFLFSIFLPVSVFAPGVSACELRPNETGLICNGPLQLLNYSGSLANISKIEVKCNTPPTQIAPTQPERLEVPRLRTLKIEGCGLETVRWLKNVRHSGHIVLDLSGNLMSGLDWHLAKMFQAQQINLRNNPVNCSCSNKWLFDFQLGTKNQTLTSTFLQLPTKILLDEAVDEHQNRDIAACKMSCPTEEIKLQPPTINTTLSATATLTCIMHGSMPFSFKPEDLFRWPTSSDQAHEERKKRWNVVKEGADTYKMQIWNLTSDDLGIVVCECLECQYPRCAHSEFRFDTQISAKIEHDGDETHLSVHGYPLRIVTLTLRRLSDNITHTMDLTTTARSNQEYRFFKSNITIRYLAELSFTSIKYYRINIMDNVKPDDYVIRVCSSRPNDCTEFMAHLKHHTLIQDDSNPLLSSPPSTSTFAYFIFVLLVVAALGALILSVFHYYRRDRTASKLANAVSWHKKRGFRRISRNTTRTEETSLRMDDSLSATMSNYSLQHVPVIDKDHLVLEEKIGKGAFGEVFIGEWRTRNVRVAVKVLHGVQVDAQMDKEAAMLAALDHDNVVKMFGVCKAAEQQSLYLVLELMNMGDLKTYIKQREPQCENYSQFPPSLLPTELINIAQQVCTGLCYIHMQQIVHRDLAARNCLVSGDSDMRVCNAAFRPPVTVKISDFGMSRRLYSQAEYYKMGDKKTALPVRWLPPECLESGRFTYQSDMWAFGVTLYELFTFGAMPYGDLSNNEALMAVISGMRPSVPSKCPTEVADIMKDCWKTAPDERPPADDALMRLKMIQ